MKYIFLSICLLFATSALQAQEGSATHSQKKLYKFTLEDVIETAKSQSPEGLQAKHSFRSSYWEFRSYKANFLPSLVFSGTLPSFTQGIEQIRQPDGTYKFEQVFSDRLSGRLAVDQNIPLTGGVLSLSTGLQRYDEFGGKSLTSYSSTPISLSYAQSIFGVNQLKWDKKIEPLKYEEAKRRYLKSIEGVSITAIRYFFDLASAQQNLAIAEFNYANNDTLFKIAGGRFRIGTIGENDLLQSELNYMNSRATVNDARLTLANAKNRLRSFLGFNESADIEILIPENVPAVDLSLDKIMNLAKQNNPDLMAYQRQLIEAEKGVATAKAGRGFAADLLVSVGLNPKNPYEPSNPNYSTYFNELGNSYKNLKDAESVSLALRIPILDWGRGKGRVKMAKSQQDLVKVQVEQAEADFEQSIILQVNQFNQQGEQFKITAKADTIAQSRYAVSKQRYLIDKITITDMNNAQNDRDSARQRYVNALRNYWNYYFTLRQVTLYDLISKKPLDVDYELLID